MHYPQFSANEFLVVDDPDWSHEDLLKAAVEIATNPKYRGARAQVTGCQQKFLRGDWTSEASIRVAGAEMHDLVTERNRAVREAKVKTSIHDAFRIGSVPAVAAGVLLAGPLGLLAAGVISATASTFLGVG